MIITLFGGLVIVFLRGFSVRESPRTPFKGFLFFIPALYPYSFKGIEDRYKLKFFEGV
jgi:hypothetical protein